jgi:hypothetical protein
MQRLSLSDLIIVGVATWYIQYILRWLSGPFGIFDWVRRTIFGVGVRGLAVVVHRQSLLAEVLTCVYCFSFWIGIVVLIGWILRPEIVWPFTVVGVVVLIEAIMAGLSRWQ